LGQARGFEKSPFKPYLMIGVAYLVWGVLGGVVGMLVKGDSFSFSRAGTAWGFVAGSLGAFGALALTLAMYSHATPHIVMPFVFGPAVSVNAITNVLTTKTQADFRLWLGIIGMGICIVTVAYFTPHAHPPKPSTAPAANEAAS